MSERHEEYYVFQFNEVLQKQKVEKPDCFN